MTNIEEKYKANFQSSLLAVTLERKATLPLQTQLLTALRKLILSDGKAIGARLPPSRQLAEELSVSRTTVLAVLDQLIAEGYLESRQGSGTFVAQNLPHLSKPDLPASDGPAPEGPAEILPFHLGAPDAIRFPHKIWARHLEAAWRNPVPDLLKAPDPLGWPPLREAIASHLKAWRGIDCSAGQVIVTSGAREAFRLIAILLGGDKTIHVEAPCFRPMLAGFREGGVHCSPLRVDEQGLDTSLLCDDMAGAVVTPSRHFPLGCTMPLKRRLAMLDWAARQDSIIVEDDYDSEFRFTGEPLPALASLDQAGHVIYVGSFSKSLSSALRLGYMVVPASRIQKMRRIIGDRGVQVSLLPQPALARFMETGEFAVHLRRMRRLYAQRQSALIALIGEHLDGWFVAKAEASGMHLTCEPGPRLDGVSDADAVAAASDAGLILQCLSHFPFAPEQSRAFFFGYAAFDEDALEQAVRKLASALRARFGKSR